MMTSRKGLRKNRKYGVRKMNEERRKEETTKRDESPRRCYYQDRKKLEKKNKTGTTAIKKH